MKRAFAVAVALAAMFASGVAAAATNGPVPTCHGKPATIVGTEGNDVIQGTEGRDVIWGGGGDDTIDGGLGSDVICGGPGNDVIHGGRGNDLVDGGPGEDRVMGDLGDDRVLGGPGNRDEVAGDLGIDVVDGGPGNEDLVHGDYGFDRMSGGPGSGDIASFATAVAGGNGSSGVWASLKAHAARGDGHDKLFGFESLEGSAFQDTLIGNGKDNVIDGGPGNDTLIGGGGTDVLNGGQGSDSCRGAKERSTSCGREAPVKASAYVQLDPVAGGGAGLQVVGGGGRDDISVAFEEAGGIFEVSAAKGLAIGAGCSRPEGVPNHVDCPAGGPARWLTADLGPGNDKLEVKGSLEAIGAVRLAGNFGDDTIRGGPEDDLIQSGPGADKLYGAGGSDGLVGGLPGPTFLYGGPGGDLLAAGGGCAGGALVGGPGRDDASFAETQAHPGLLIISFIQHAAYDNSIKGCRPVRLSPTDEDMEGSFDNDVLIGDSRGNSMLGQPGEDEFFGNGGPDVIDARDGVRDKSIQCGVGKPPKPGKEQKGGGKQNGGGSGNGGGGKHGRKVPPRAKRSAAEPPTATKPGGKRSSLALTDPFDPAPVRCAHVKFGHPVPGLNG